MDRTRASLKGFTLVELLITITIMSLVIGIATYGFLLFSNRWSTDKAGFRDAVASLQRFELVNAAITDAIPWVVRSENGRLGYYFLGREEGLTLVTDSPIFSAGGLAVIRVFREAEADGRSRLVYEEAPIENVALVRADQTLPFKHRLIVTRGVRGLSFRFFGWKSAQSRSLAEDEGLGGGQPEWFEEFDGLIRGVHPQRIGLRLGGSEVVYDIPDKGGHTVRRLVDEQ